MWYNQSLARTPRDCSTDDESYARYAVENQHFHYLIAKASGNHELAETLGHLHDRLARFIVMCCVGETLKVRHARLIKALRTRDVAATHQAMLDEINGTRDTILERVIQQEGAFWRLGNRAE